MASVQGLGPGVSEIRFSPPEIEICNKKPRVLGYGLSCGQMGDHVLRSEDVTRSLIVASGMSQVTTP